MVAVGMRGQAMRRRHRAVGPGLALERLGALGAVLEARQHLGDGTLLARAGQAVEILQVEEGRIMLVQARLQ